MSAGSTLGLVINFILFSILSSVLGFAVDILVTIANNSPDMGMDALTLLSQLHVIWVAGPIIYLIVLIINHIVVSNSEMGGEV